MRSTVRSLGISDIPARFPVTLWWSEYKPGLLVPTIRGVDLALHVEFHRYVLAVAKSANQNPAAFDSTMHPVAYTLLDFAKHLTKMELTWENVDDEVLRKFRDQALSATKSSSISRSEESAKVTTNIKLRIIYDFYAWTHLEAMCKQPIIGWGKDFPIHSSLTLFAEKQNKWAGRAVRKYPLCYRGVGENSKSVGAQYWATNADLNDIEDFFHLSQPAKTAARNILFMRIADQTGFRRASINSLVAGQFTEEAIEKSMKSDLKGHAIRPRNQKLGKNYYFELPYALAWEINRYLKTQYVQDSEKEAATDELWGNLPVFVSMTTGKQITNKRWSDIFTAAFQAIGAPMGSGLHSIRRKFAEEWFRARIHEFKTAGKPTEFQAIVAGLARVLGQDSKLSQEAYRRASAITRGATPLDVLAEQNCEQAATIRNLSAQLEEQRAMLEKLRRPSA